MTDLFAAPVTRPKAPSDRTVAVLCCSSTSPYKAMKNVEAFDRRRDVRTFAGGMPVVVHPPCGPWSAYVSHQSKAGPEEKDLGPLCVDHLKREGGVLEHPAHSRLFSHCGLPMPGTRWRDLFTVEVHQAWWGYPMMKATWLVFCRVNVLELEFPFHRHDSRAGLGDRRRQQVMSKQQRAATHPSLAEWLVAAARLSRPAA